MSQSILNNMGTSARRHSFVCLLLFVLSLFSMAIASNNMISPASNMMSMDMHDMATKPHSMSKLSDHDMSTSEKSSCMSNGCAGMATDHNHQKCIDNHCGSFTGILASYRSESIFISFIQVVLPSDFYVSTYPSTPYSPPIVIS